MKGSIVFEDEVGYVVVESKTKIWNVRTFFLITSHYGKLIEYAIVFDTACGDDIYWDNSGKTLTTKNVADLVQRRKRR